MHPSARHVLLLIAATVAFASCKQRTIVQRPMPADPRWAAIDSLANLGQYATALERTDTLLAQASRSGDWRSEFKAWMRRADFHGLTGGDEVALLKALGDRARVAPVPLSQLLHSVRAEGWWNKYNDERWIILQRTELASMSDDDPETWTQQRYMAEVIEAFSMSVRPIDTLSRIPVGELGFLLEGDSGARYLRPTLFDLLAHRAIAVFRNSETRLAEPAWRFTLDDPHYFTLFEPFAMRPLRHRDSTAWEFQALRLYQEMERIHLVDDTIAAYVDLVTDRLAYVHEHCALPDKDSLHLAALELLRTRLPEDVCWSETTVEIARWHARAADAYDRLGGDAWKWERKRAVELCDSAIARWPASFGARNARALRERLKQAEVNVQCEQAVPSRKDFLVSIEYRNAPHVWLRVVKDPTKEGESQYGQDHALRLAALKPELAWDLVLPDDGDLNSHHAELPVAGLPYGKYVVLASTSAAFNATEDPMVWCSLQVTDMAVVRRESGPNLEVLVLDRTTGLPLTGVNATLFVEDYSSGERRKEKIATLVTDAEGRVRAPRTMRNGRAEWLVEHGEDRYTCGNLYVYPRYDGVEEEVRSFLFTDRAIYRPGQEMHVKGIVTKRSGKNAEIVTGYRARVFFHDVNGEMIDSLIATTDAYGAFHGTFTLPLGGLTGMMRLHEEHGDKWIRVEEYKRPTFEALFEPIAATPRLGEEAVVTGVATSYAGAPLDGARVRYTVKRSARMPWWCGWQWRGLGWWQQTEVASGEATCDAQGRFTVRFLAEASRSFPRAADPSFAFDVEAWVTDINGETQSATTSFVVGYRSIEPVLGVGNAIDRSAADSLVARIDNLNGQRVDLPFDLRITRLLRPDGRLKRVRLWERPDRHVLTEEEFARRFADEERTDMDDPGNWARGAVVLDQHGLSPEGKRIALTGVRDWEVGTYIAQLDVVDPNGQTVKVSQVFTLFDPEIQRTGFENEAFHVEALKARCEPGEKAVLLLSSALPACRALMEVERDGAIVVSRPFTLRNGQQRVELPVLEGDRGGFAVHFVCVERGRDHNSTQWIDVPWSNKQLKAEWMSFRDKLLPGAKEEWRLRITGPQKEKVAAQLLAAMYDASLDAFETPDWSMPIHGSNNAMHAWAHSEPFGIGGGYHNYVQRYAFADSSRRYPLLVGELPQRHARRRFRTMAAPAFDGRLDMAGDGAEQEATGNVSFSAGLTNGVLDEEDDAGKRQGERTEAGTQAGGQGGGSLRTDFRETAFFFPDLLTDRDGEVVLRFTMPDALTRWNFMGLAHTKELQLAHIARSTITQKPLMVMPNLPRFLRQGDRITLTAKINKMEEGATSGTAHLELFDPRTNAAITSRFTGTRTDRAFTAAPGKSANVSWALQIPEDVDAVAVRMTASGAGFSDGEERVLPILTDRVLVTESVPIAISKAGTRTFELPNLLGAAGSTTLTHRSLTLEYTPNPAWYAVQALPYLMEFPHECAEQVFSRYYANRLATHIVQQRPAVRKVFDAWSKASPGNEGAFLSALEKNPELRGVLLEETPWVMNAKEEGERKRRVALFFDLHRMATEEAMSMKKLGDMQLPNGAWPWWSGMQPSRYITQHIVAGFGHLHQLGAINEDPDTDAGRMMKSAVEWLDKQADEDYRRMLRDFKGDTIPHPSAEDIHYLYARTCFPQYPLDRRRDALPEFIITRAERYWLHYGLQEQAMIAIALHRLGNQDVPALIMESLAQRATVSEELGMYWKGFNAGYHWSEFPTETHALMIEAFERVTQDKRKVNALRQYLLKLKQTTDWRTTKATADACYALLLTGDDWLEPRNAPAITVGGERVRPQAQEAGTGYFTKAWQGNDVKPAMGRVTVTSTEDALQWGALHWQYFERMDMVKPHESPFSLRRQVMLNEQTDAGARLIPLDSARALKAGDKLTVRVELRTDRYLDFVHLKDLRAAGLDPVATVSGYQWKGGLGYYQSIRDAAMNFFFDRIAPGTYVFEYGLKATHAGVFSNGITSAQCMYAPEFSSHSQGLVITIGQP